MAFLTERIFEPGKPVHPGWVYSAGRYIRCSWCWVLMAVVFLIIWTRTPAGHQRFAHAMTFEEGQVKAVVLFNLARFVTWPPESFESPDTPVTFMLLGKTELGAHLKRIVSGERVNGRPIVVVQQESWNGVPRCHILFIDASRRRDFSMIMETAHQLGALSVGDSPGFCQSGGITNLVRVGNRISIEINVAAAKSARLRFDTRLLRLAKIVRHASGKEVN